MTRLVLLYVLVECLSDVVTQNYCQCDVSGESTVRNYDNVDFQLQLPCEYYLTDVTTRTGCHVGVTLESETLFGFGTSVEMRGVQFSVDRGKDKIFGSISNSGVQKRNDTMGDNIGFNLPSIISEGNLHLQCYEDMAGFYTVYVPPCDTTLRYHTNGLAIILTPQDAVTKKQPYLCGNCDGNTYPLTSLPGGVGKNLTSEEDILAGWLYHTSLLIEGGERTCLHYRSDLARCSPREAFDALRICGSLLSNLGDTSRCIQARAGRPQIHFAFFKCIRVQCNPGVTDRKQSACSVVKDVVNHFACPVGPNINC